MLVIIVGLFLTFIFRKVVYRDVFIVRWKI